MIKNYESTSEDLLDKKGKPDMNLRRTRSLCREIYKTLNNLNLEFMKGLIRFCPIKRVLREKHKFDLEIPKVQSGNICY